MTILGVPVLGFVITILNLQKSWAIVENHVIIQAEFYLSPDKSGEFMFDFDGDEIFHVDMEKRETVWRLEEFGHFASFEAQGALANIAVDKANLEIMIKRSNNTPNTNVPPEVTVLSDKPVTRGVSETVFLPREDHLFRKFHYLPFMPSTEDVYDCQVEHWGLDKPLLKHWGKNHPSVSFVSWFSPVMPACAWCFGILSSLFHSSFSSSHPWSCPTDQLSTLPVVIPVIHRSVLSYLIA
uniref:MHC class II antigen n=1 Tax=Sus scrofa TaxID=9823 RepID=A0A8D0ZJ37_PIG